MGEVALYRKYRSQTFETVIGQPHIMASLMRAVKTGRISHAYLFTGPRGVGKTSVARLVARGVNCQAKPPSNPKPCGTCGNCTLEPSANLDIIEIDAASNRRIDEIRDLRDKVNLSPAHSRYKVYIIDEVHMLTTEAFNALLKTLEEPPSHVIFILATTEAHKIPETIISRTQRFHFQPITDVDLLKGLQKIAAAEKIQADPAALALIAGAGRGSFRDAISLLDQAAGADLITPDTVRQLLGWTDQEVVDGLSVSIATGEAKQALEQLDQAYAQGFAAGQLISQLISRWRGFLHHAAGRLSAADPAAETVSSELGPAGIAAVLEALVAAHRSGWPELSLEALIAKRASTSSQTSSAAPSVAVKPKLTSPATPAQASVPAAQAAQPSGNFDEHWQKALMLIKNRNNSLYALLRSCTVRLDGDQLVLGCRFNFHKDRLGEPKNREIIEAALDKTYHRPIRVAIELEQAQAKTSNGSEAELVSSALEILGGEVIDG